MLPENDEIESDSSPDTSGQSDDAPVVEADSTNDGADPSSPETALSPDDGNASATEPTGKAVPYDRFNEVIRERNTLREQHLATQQMVAQYQAQFRAMQEAQQRAPQAPQQPQVDERNLDPTQRALLHLHRQNQELASWRNTMQQQMESERQSRQIESLKAEVAAAFSKYPSVPKNFEKAIVADKITNPNTPIDQIVKSYHDMLEKTWAERQKTYVNTKVAKAEATKGTIRAGTPAPPSKREINNFSQAEEATKRLIRERRSKNQS